MKARDVLKSLTRENVGIFHAVFYGEDSDYLSRAILCDGAVILCPNGWQDRHDCEIVSYGEALHRTKDLRYPITVPEEVIVAELAACKKDLNKYFPQDQAYRSALVERARLEAALEPGTWDEMGR